MIVDFDEFEIEALGLTSRQVELFLTSSQGIGYQIDDSCTPKSLAYEIRVSASQSLEDHANYGYDLGFIRNDSPKVPNEYAELADVIERMPTWQALALQYFTIGFWRGIRKSSEQAKAA